MYQEIVRMQAICARLLGIPGVFAFGRSSPACRPNATYLLFGWGILNEAVFESGQ
jgi:hypothetical protein